MDARVSAAVAVGSAALQTLNTYLRDTDTAKGWYGTHYYEDFTKSNFSLKKFLGLDDDSPREIKEVFALQSTDWQYTIEYCLSNTQVWLRYARHNEKGKDEESRGECSWLPIYAALPANYRKHSRASSKKSASSLAAVRSLPAARFDAWGLVVLAIANGAKIQIQHGSEGGYFAELSGKTFVVTIWQKDVGGSITAHIEPRAYSSEQHTMMTSPEWQNLLWYGHSFSQHHHIFGWPLNDTPVYEAPKNLTTTHHDAELKELVIDNKWTTLLQDQLREALYSCHDAWESAQNMDEMNGLNKKIEAIKRQLLSFKLILVDDVDPSETSLVIEIRRKDALHYATKQLNKVHEFNARYQHQQGDGGQFEEADGGPELHMSHKVKELLRQQKVVTALIRLLSLPQKLDKVLSTRATGTYVSVV